MNHPHVSLAGLLSWMQITACGHEAEDMAATMTTGALTETWTTGEPSTTDPVSATDPASSAASSSGSTGAPNDEASVDGGEMSDDHSGDGGDTLGFGTHVWPIIDARCSCHKTSNPSGDLDLRADAAYDSLVDMPSTQDPETLLVAPFAPHESYLFWKITGVQPVGGVMPPGTPLSQVELDSIEQWIAEGAQP